MVEWAKRAGSLVFQKAEALCEDNIVTFCILGTFWYGQGSWRLSYLHKGLHLSGIEVGGRQLTHQQRTHAISFILLASRPLSIPCRILSTWKYSGDVSGLAISCNAH